jgi:sugar phosphate isomerase/epimerase
LTYRETGSSEDRVRNDQIALQLYTVRRPLARDVAGTLNAVGRAGYQAVELAGLPPIDTPALAAALADAGLQPVSAHESLESLRADEAAAADRLNALGCPRLVVPSMPASDQGSADTVRRVGAELAGIADRLQSRGIRLAYHNHAFEFDPLDGTTIWDALIGALPDTVDLEIDVYWASVAGRDPAELIASLGQRVRLLHMKDRAPGPEPRDEPPGAGILPWPRIIEAARDAGVEWYIVEQDEPREPLADIETGRRHLAGMAA